MQRAEFSNFILLPSVLLGQVYPLFDLESSQNILVSIFSPSIHYPFSRLVWVSVMF